ncbi:glycosyltransferase family 39 protein [Massilia sp. YIM B04103]|uniref:DUF7024 domain-containing protein n=1 Tax=Massilia sp. YIM B04103 TaxID=2963106 RepID=UPI00210EB07C|nr:glycosyltransferase family 39 protein [Massilia sp. YIM B04103]
MTAAPTRLTPAAFRSLGLLSLFFAFVYLTLRNTGLYPSIFGDEWSYSSAARLLPLREAPLPSYLYFLLYRSTNQCGEGFLECARSLNVLFFVASTPFIYLLARRLCSRPLAAWVALLSLLRPANSYTAFFMPEAMYYWGFWLLSWHAFQIHERPDWRRASLGGVLLGLLFLVKLHALFLLPGYALFLLYCSRAARTPGAPWLARGLLLAGLSSALMLAVRFGLGYLLGGPASLSLTGTLYAGQTPAQIPASLAALLLPALANLGGHLMALALLLGLPLAGLLLQGLSRQQRAASAPPVNALALYSFLMLGQLLAVTVLFTAMVAGHGAESTARLHMRYYDFILPLFLILAAAQAETGPVPAPRAARLLAGLALAGLLAYGAVRLASFAPNYIDSPELFGAARTAPLRYGLAGLGLLCLLLWLGAPRRGARLYLFGLLPLFVLAAGYQLNVELRQTLRPDLHAQAGQVVRHYLTPAETNYLTLVGDDAAALFKTRFLLDNARTALLLRPQGHLLDNEELGGADAWVLAFGDYRLPSGAHAYLGQRGYTLARLAPESGQRRPTKFNEPEAEWSVVARQGLAGPESWGRWSDGDEVILEFKQDLPPACTLRLDVAAYGPNAGQNFTFHLGGETRQARVAGQRQKIDLQFAPAAGARTLRIRVPQAVSPRQRGESDDGRRLGLAFYRLHVLAHGAPAQASR